VVYLIGLGAVALGFALYLPRGIWGAIEQRFGLRLLPVGYIVARDSSHNAD
jgi:branched-chain amino acid transport system permease protein